MIFKTIDDNDSLSGQRIVSKFTARKIAQEEATRQLEIDIQCLRNYEAECQKGSVSTETFSNTMKGASVEAQKYAVNIKEGTCSAQTFATNQRTIQASMSETSIVSKVAATGLSIFKAALNSLIFFAVIEGIQLLIKGIDNLILTADEAEEKAEALRGNMQSFFDEVQSGQQTISSVSDRFSELSEHVTKTGENIDLTKDEYSEYLDICNQVKTIMPELVTGYTNEGNAIITLKDNVDSLTEAYKENIRAKAAAFITNGDDDGNTIQSFFDDYKIFTEGENGLFAPSAGGLWNNKSTDYEDYYGYDKVHEWLEDVADLSLKDLQNLQKGTTQATYLYALLKENGYELANITEDNYEAVHDVLDTRLTSLEGEMATRVSNVKMSLQQMLYADGDYWDIDNKEALSAIDSMFSSIDSEFIKQNNLLGQDALQSFESNVVKLFEDKDTQKAMIDIYTPQSDDESIEDYSKRVNDAIKKVQNYAKDKKIDIPLDFTDATDNVKDIQKSYDDTINRFKDSNKIKDFFTTEGINTQDEIDAFNDVTKGINDADKAIQTWNEHKKESNETPISLDTSSAIEKLKKLEDTMSGLDSAMASLVSGENVDLSSLDKIRESFSELENVDLEKVNKSLEQIANAKSVEQAQSAMNSLANEYLNLSGILNGLNESNKDLISTELKSIGISNAQEIVEANLTAAKQSRMYAEQALSAASSDLASKQEALTMASSEATNVTYQESAAFVQESNMSDIAKISLMDLIAQQNIFSNTGLNVDDKIANLAALAEAYMGAAASASFLNKVQTSQDGALYGGGTISTQEAWKQELEKYKTQYTPVVKPYTGGSSTKKATDDAAKKSGDKGDNADKAKDTAEEVKQTFYAVFDWMEKKINYLEKITSKAIDKISNSLQYAMNKSFISKTFKKINEQMSTNAYMVQRYNKSAEDVGLQDETLKQKIKNGGNIDYYKKHNADDDFSHIYDEALNDKITAYADWIDKSLQAAEANDKLKDSVKELAETISQAPIDKASEKVEKLDSATELLEAKVENRKTAKNKNKLLNVKTKDIDKTLSTYKTAYKTSTSNEKRYENKITKQKVAKGATDKQKNKFKSLMSKVKSAAKGKKKISDKTLESIYSYCASVKDFTWYQNAVTYNSSIEAMDSAKQTYDLYKETSRKDKREIAKEKFDNVVTEYDNKIGLIDNGITDIDNKLDLTEAKGMLVNTNYYKQQKAIKSQEQSYYQQELVRLQELANGIEKGTQEWYDAQSSIQECKNSISECTKAQLEYNNSINEANVEKYEKISTLIGRTSTEMEFLEKLMSHDKLFDDNGSFTNSGLATLGTYATSYYSNIQNVNRDKAELDRLKGMLASGDLGTYNSVEQLQQRIDDLYDTWQDDISAVYSAQESIFNMMSDKFDAELDALQKLVDRRKEALDTEKEIFDYQNKISEKTKSINTLQKQIAAYKGDTSQEGRAKLQKLQVSLQDAQKDLKDTEYEKYISDQEDMLDKLLDEFKENIEKRLEDFKRVVNDGLDIANKNSADILANLQKVSSENGYTMQFSTATNTTLQGYVNTIVAAINSRTENAIDTPSTTTDNTQTGTSGVNATTQVVTNPGIVKETTEDKIAKEKEVMHNYKNKALEYIKVNAKKASKEPSTDLNKVIYKNFGKKYLSETQRKELAKLVGVKYNNASKSGNLYQRLHDLNVKGFKDGGIAKLIKSKGEDGIGILQNGEGLVAPKHVKSVQELLDLTPLITDMIKVNQPDYTKFASMITPIKNQIGDVQFNFELTECENAQDIIKQIQTDPKVQQALRSVTTDQMLGKSRLSVNRIK